MPRISSFAAWITLLALAAAGCVGSSDLRPRRDPYSGACVPGDGSRDYSQPFDYEHPFDYDWPLCSSPCDGLGSEACQATGGCRAILTTPCSNGTGMSQGPQFVTCWATMRDGPLRGDDCTTIIDAAECARHDDCQAVHDHTVCNGSSYVTFFQFCWWEGPLPPPPPPPPADAP